MNRIKLTGLTRLVFSLALCFIALGVKATSDDLSWDSMVGQIALKVNPILQKKIHLKPSLAFPVQYPLKKGNKDFYIFYYQQIANPTGRISYQVYSPYLELKLRAVDKKYHIEQTINTEKKIGQYEKSGVQMSLQEKNEAQELLWQYQRQTLSFEQKNRLSVLYLKWANENASIVQELSSRYKSIALFLVDLKRNKLR
jgi:hypothetical protein